MNQPQTRSTSLNASLQLLSKISTNQIKTFNNSIRSIVNFSRKTTVLHKIHPKLRIQPKKKSFKEKTCIKANTIRTKLLVSIDKLIKNRISKCKINSKTPNEILASYDSFEITIENPVEIGTPILNISRQSLESNSTPKSRIMLEEKIDFNGVVSKLRKKKTISMDKFRNFVESSLQSEKKEETKDHPIMKQKDTKYELMIQSCQYLRCLVYRIKKEKLLKSKLLSTDTFCSMHNSLSEYSTKSKVPKPSKKKKRRKSNGSGSRNNNKNNSPSESDDDDLNNNDNYIQLSNHTLENDRSQKKAVTSLAFNYSSFKSVNSQITKNINDNYQPNDDGNIIFLNHEEENEMNDTLTPTFSLNLMGGKTRMLSQERDRYSLVE